MKLLLHQIHSDVNDYNDISWEKIYQVDLMLCKQKTFCICDREKVDHFQGEIVVANDLNVFFFFWLSWIFSVGWLPYFAQNGHDYDVSLEIRMDFFPPLIQLHSSFCALEAIAALAIINSFVKCSQNHTHIHLLIDFMFYDQQW